MKNLPAVVFGKWPSPGLTICLLLCSVSTGLSQNFSITGSVIDSITLQPIEYASVSILRPDSSIVSGGVTDSTGSFQIDGLTEKNILVQIQFIGYQTKSIGYALEEGARELNLHPISLVLSSVLLNEILVHGAASKTILRIDRQVIDMNQFQNASTGTALDALKNIAAITVTNQGDISLRGSEGFIVLINGRPSSRTPAEILAQIPAQNIDNIEILTSPAARFDADGKSGIINILTKVQDHTGWSVSSNGMFGGVDPLRFSGDVLIQHTAKSLTFFAGGDYRRFDFDGFRYGYTRTIVEDTLSYLPSVGIRDYREHQYAGRAGINYQMNENNTLTVNIYAGFKQSDRQANLHYIEYYNISPDPLLFDTHFGEPRSRFFNENLFVRTGEFYTSNIDFSHLFHDKSSITLFALYEYSVLGGPLTQKETDETGGNLISNERSDETNPLDAFRLQADYSIHLKNNMQFDAGYTFRHLHHTGDFSFERQDLLTGEWYNDPLFSNELDLTQVIHAGYFQLSGERNAIGFSIGLRAEYMERDLIHRLETTAYHYDKLDLFPSVQGLWSLPKDQKLRLGFNRRIDRPTTRLMAPFKNRRHTESIEIGDPNLLPEISHLVDLSYSKQFKQTTFASTAYYNSVSNKIFRLNNVYDRHTLLRSYTNAGNATSIGIEVTGDIIFTDWLRSYLAGNIYHFNVEGTAENTFIEQSSLNYTVKSNTTVQLLKQLSFQWDFNYVSETVTAQGSDGSLFLSNAGLKYSSPNHLVSIGLTFQNVFRTNEQVFITEAENFYSSIEFIKYDRALLLTAGLNLNDSGKKNKLLKTDYGEKDF